MRIKPCNKLIAIFIILLASCQTPSSEHNQANVDDKYVENEMLCQISNHKLDYIGQELTIFGTHVTDFLHYSSLRAKCKNGETRGLTIGFVSKTEKNILIEKQWDNIYCSGRFSCMRMAIPVTFRGKLKKYDDGIYFDIDEIIIDETKEN